MHKVCLRQQDFFKTCSSRFSKVRALQHANKHDRSVNVYLEQKKKMKLTASNIANHESNNIGGNLISSTSYLKGVLR